MAENESGDGAISGAAAADIAHQISGRAEDYVNDVSFALLLRPFIILSLPL